MKYFLRFLLGLVISATVLVTYGSIQGVGNQNSKFEKVRNIESRKSKRSNNVKQDGLQLKMEWQKIVAISIHENKPGVTAKFSFTVSLTNNTPAPLLNSAIVITAIVGWFRRFITTKLTVITWIDLV